MQLATIIGALSAAGLLQSASAAPFEKRQINNDDVPGTALGPPGATGSLYGPTSLLGNAGDSTATPSINGLTATGSLVPGQTADPDLGFFLDMSQAAAPQPIRGDEGSTDPGPRTFHSQIMPHGRYEADF